MAVLGSISIPWRTLILFLTLPRSNVGLLSDYKICGGSGCESPISRVQAIVDHRGKDCRFLNFRRGEIITVYQKLTGTRDDLWAGSINQNFGYFPKEAVKQYHIYTTEEKRFETQKSDFFCIDELGFPVDTSHLDSENETTDQESKSTPKTELPSEEPAARGLLAEAKGSKHDGNIAVEKSAEAIEELDKQGGLVESSSWLSPSSWLGFTKEKQPVDKETNDNIVENQAQDSLPSSVKSEEKKTEATESLASTVSGWIGFGGNDKSINEDSNKNNEDDKEETNEPKFRSRKIHLDLEGSQLQEEKKEMGTFAWLGDGLSSTLGLSGNNPEPTALVKENEEMIETEQRSNSWFDLGIKDILPFRTAETIGTETLSEETLVPQEETQLSSNTDTKAESAGTSGFIESLSIDQQDLTNQDDNMVQFVAAGDGPEEKTIEGNADVKIEETISETIDHNPSASDGSEKINQRKDDHGAKVYSSDLSITQSKDRNIVSEDVGTSTPKQNEDAEMLQLTPKATEEKEENLQETDNNPGPDSTSPVSEETHEEKPFQEVLEVREEVRQERMEVTDGLEKAVNVELESNEKALGFKEELTVEAKDEGQEKPELNGEEKDELEGRHSREEPKDDHEELQTQKEDKVDDAEINDVRIEHIQEEVVVECNRMQEDGNLKEEDQDEEMELRKEIEVDVEMVQAKTGGEEIKTRKENVELNLEKHVVEIQEQKSRAGISREEEKEIDEDIQIQDNDKEGEKRENQESKDEKEQKGEREEIEMVNEEKGENDLESEDHVIEEEKQEEVKSDEEPQEEADEEDDQVKQREKEEHRFLTQGEEQEEMKEEKKEELPRVEEEEEILEEKLVVNGDMALENQEREEEEHPANKEKEQDEREIEEVEKQDKQQVKEDNILEEMVEKGEMEIMIKEEETEIKEHEENAKEELQISKEDEKEGEEKEMQQEEQNTTEEVTPNLRVVDEKQEEQVIREVMEQKETEVKEESGKGGKEVKELVVQVEEERQVEEAASEQKFIQEDLEKQKEELKETNGLKDKNDLQDSETEEQTLKDGEEEDKVEGNKKGNDEEEHLELDTRQDEARNDPQTGPTNDIKDTDGGEVGNDEDVAGETRDLADGVKEAVESSSGDASDPLDDNDSETGGTLGLLKNAFFYFGGSSATEMSKPSEAELTMETDPGQKLELESKPDSTASSPQTPATPSAPPPEVERANRAFFKQYRNLLAHVSMDEMNVLMELFGQTKLQFLDFIMGQSENVIDENDKSILSDIETLLQHHNESLKAPSKVEERTTTLIALQKLQVVLDRVRETFSSRTSDIARENPRVGCVGDTCRSNSKTEKLHIEEKSKAENDERLDEHVGQKGEAEKQTEQMKNTGSVSVLQSVEGFTEQFLDFIGQIAEDSSAHVHAAGEFYLKVVSSLPDDIRPGPDLYGVPWEPVIVTSVLGFLTMLLFTCRCYSSVKSRMYRSKERWMASQVAQTLDEKCKVLETLSTYQEEYNELEDLLRGNGMLAQTLKSKHMQVKTKQLEKAKTEMEGNLIQLKEQLERQREHRLEQERRIAVLEESLKMCEAESKELQSLEEQAQTTLKVYDMNSDRKQRSLETAAEENTLLQESNAQLRQQVEGWAERVSELEEQMRRCEVSYTGMVQDVATKDERITALTDRLLRMRVWESDLDGGAGETSYGATERGEEQSEIQIQKVQKLIYAAKLNADLKSVDEDKDRVFAKLSDEVKAKEDLQVSIEELEKDKLSMQTDSEHYSEQVQKLQQKLQIMTEMYQENELKLHRLLTVEEKERLQKEEKLNKADKNIALAIEEVKNHRHRAEEMEEELEKTKQSYQTQISAHEKKAHNNWLASRAAERDLTDIRRENALIRQKLTDTQFKLDALDKDPYALDTLARPLPFRGERSPYGPSPLGRPSSETRTLLSPPTLMEAPMPRLSPRMPRVPLEPPVQGEREGSGPHSDSGSNSPTWERDRRGPPPGPPGPMGPPGYMFPEPGGPMYRRPLPPLGVMGPLPPPGSHPLGPPPPHLRGPPGPPHPADMAEGSFRENSFGPGELNHRELGPLERRTPPDADPRSGGFPPPGPPMGPMDGPFPRRGPYGPPPPDFYPPRGPGGPPMMPMWAPPPSGMMMPPRFPPGGPLPPPYCPPVRHLPPDGLPPPSMGPRPHASLPPQPRNQSPDEHTPPPQDVI